tara:strand:+ start:687 stop:1163 length:477 start_codon:yes stop_codon:yes gene_type:complete
MGIPLYGQNKDGNALSSITESRGYTKIAAGVTLDGSEGGIIHIADADACAIVLPTISDKLHGLEYKFIMANDAGGSITITSTDSSGNFYQGTLAVHSVDSDNGFAANGTSNNIITMNATTTGGLLGSEVNIRAYSGIGWIVWGNLLGSDATGATPFSG